MRDPLAHVPAVREEVPRERRAGRAETGRTELALRYVGQQGGAETHGQPGPDHDARERARCLLREVLREGDLVARLEVPPADALADEDGEQRPPAAQAGRPGRPPRLAGEPLFLILVLAQAYVSDIDPDHTIYIAGQNHIDFQH